MWKNIFMKSAATMLLLVIGLTVSAQVVIRGKIADKKGNPLQGVSVSVMDADNRIVSGTSTDIEGNFVLKNVNTKYKLSFSFIGYKTQTIPVGTKTEFAILMEDSQTDLG
ncbi:MAG TPA: carboxypeptidase-like regulatory domain-containing protein, partial [Chitinophagaceae bacterium]|nr:carboxypeptidase-like regulatory domain-containing protein [Chitinophagaceae bacterium]HPH32748.1 carboxypeptidase-like regulatory domain-containing protein [Chitinophagaceae bacterium]